ncbi:single-strand DNA-binding protein [Pseudomonas duriflava]|uniref:Single-stranded DNA-binding protein n=1 Tax=Pseudomonas duriflava TaxID=459528 RepID=A0A562PUJ4_9PSED|nr:single-stranded DNA-binding protein [Pseudomonas duriflava]TWI48033.1 single-strand DNA-binding protein [Pseudomonas duriflava]
MPQLIDVGRIGRDSELRYTPSGDAVLNLAIACDYGRKGNDGKRPTQWVDATLWGKQAEALAPYLPKGQQVYFVADDAHVEMFTKGDGSQGVKLTGRISQIKLVGSAPQGQQAKPAQQPALTTQSYEDFDDSIPF